MRRANARPIENAAFRIGRDAIANAVLHAAPRRIEIEATFREAAFALQLRDDGRGLTTEEAEAARLQGHFGLSGVRERATRLGGRRDIGRRDGGGTVVTLELPMPGVRRPEAQD